MSAAPRPGEASQQSDDGRAAAGQGTPAAVAPAPTEPDDGQTDSEGGTADVRQHVRPGWLTRAAIAAGFIPRPT